MTSSRNADMIAFRPSYWRYFVGIGVGSWLLSGAVIGATELIGRRSFHAQGFLIACLSVLPVAAIGAWDSVRNLTVSVSSAGLLCHQNRKAFLIGFDDEVSVRSRRRFGQLQLWIKIVSKEHDVPIPLFMGEEQLLKALELYGGSESKLFNGCMTALRKHSRPTSGSS